MPFPGKSLKTKEEGHYNKFCEWIKPIFLQIPVTNAIKLPPYSKYMKDIVTNKIKFPNEAISTMLANYSFSGKIPEKLGDPGIPTIPCSLKNNYVKTTLCDLGAGVSVIPFSLYKSLCLVSGPGVSVCKSRYDIVIWRAENRTHLSKQTRPSTERSRKASYVRGIPSRPDDQLRWVLIVRTQV